MTPDAKGSWRPCYGVSLRKLLDQLLSSLLLISCILAVSMTTQERHRFHGTIAWGDMGEPDGLGRCRGWDGQLCRVLSLTKVVTDSPQKWMQRCREQLFL